MGVPYLGQDRWEATLVLALLLNILFDCLTARVICCGEAIGGGPQRRDAHGGYQLENGCNKSAFPNGVEDFLDILVGYFSGPLHPETQEERIQRKSECVLIEE